MAKAKAKAEVILPPGRLWPDTPWGSPMEIEVFGATGEFSTGKTILGASIAPGVHPEGHPFVGEPRTLFLDLEKSGTTYAGTGCKRIDVPAELSKAYGPNYTSKQAAEWFNLIPTKVKPGQFDVCMVDPINDIEGGEVDIVKANPKAYGYTANQINNSVGLLMAAMKAHYKKLLMAFVPDVFKLLYFTTHLRDEFKGGKPSGRREPRGKETLSELASLYLWLERSPDSEIPSAIVLKHRLSDTRVNEDGLLEIVELMPRRIPAATVHAIRTYIANPPNIKKPAKGEQVIEVPVTEIEIERTRLATAEAQAEAAMAQANLIDRQKELQAIRQAAKTPEGQAAEAVKVHKEDAELAAKMAEQQKEGKRLSAAAPPDNLAAHRQPQPLSERAQRFVALSPASGVDPEKLKAAIAKHGAARFSELSEQHQDALLEVLQKATDARKPEITEEPAKN